jgi:hypothetical protein
MNSSCHARPDWMMLHSLPHGFLATVSTRFRAYRPASGFFLKASCTAIPHPADKDFDVVVLPPRSMPCKIIGIPGRFRIELFGRSVTKQNEVLTNGAPSYRQEAGGGEGARPHVGPRAGGEETVGCHRAGIERDYRSYRPMPIPCLAWQRPGAEVRVAFERPGSQEYILPLSTIRDMIKLPPQDAHHYRGLTLAQVRGTTYSIFNVADDLGLAAVKTPELSIAIVESGTAKPSIGSHSMLLTGEQEGGLRFRPPWAQLAAWLRAAWNAGLKLPRVRAMLRRKPAVSDSEARAWNETLGQVIADLDLLNRNTEQDFLRIGGKLGEFIEAVSLISSQLTGLVNLISGGEGFNTSQALANALECFLEMRTRYAERNGGLAGMRQEAARFRETLTGFQKTVVAFQVIGVLTQIETARLGSAGADFSHLAGDVKLLAGQVQAKVESALEIGELLIPPIESAIQNIAAFEQDQMKDLAGALASLAAFREIQNRARDSSIRLGARFEVISAAFKKLIVSIQFHDITRQQVEHVIEVLRRISSEWERENGCGRRGFASVLALQSAQLADAAERFAASVASVANNLDDIATQIVEAAAESRSLSGSSEDQRNTFFLQMEHGCIAILGDLRHLKDADSATLITSSGLHQTIARMRGSIEDIQATEIQMHRMALNASIRASDIGAPGDALGFLAGSMLDGASESRQRSESLQEALGSMSEATLRLAGQNGTDVADRSARHDAVLSGVVTAVAGLHSSGERSIVQIAAIIAAGTQLRESLSATRDGFSVGGAFDEAVSRARGMLKEIAPKEIEEKTQSGLSHDAETPEVGMADFAMHYTMQSELDVDTPLTSQLCR